jgi:hypothetical protein
MADGVAQGVGPEFKPQYLKKKSIPINKWANELALRRNSNG